MLNGCPHTRPLTTPLLLLLGGRLERVCPPSGCTTTRSPCRSRRHRPLLLLLDKGMLLLLLLLLRCCPSHVVGGIVHVGGLMPPGGGRGCRLALRLSPLLLSPLLPPLLLLLLLPWTPLVGGHILSAAHHPGVQVKAQCPRLRGNNGRS